MITLIERDLTSLTIAWPKLEHVEYSEVQMLDLNAAEQEWRTITEKFHNNFLRKKNLQGDKGFIFRIRSKFISQQDLSEYCEPSEVFYLVSSDCSMLKAPSLVSSDQNSITIQWEPVEGAIGYSLRFRQDTDIHWQKIESIIKGTTAKKKSLLPNTNYFFSVIPLFENDDNAERKCWSYSLSGGPFRVALLHPTIQKYFPEELLAKSKENKVIRVKTADVLAGKNVFLYFSAHWCGPCRRFTPQLVDSYRSLITAKELYQSKYEIVFVSCDHSNEEFLSYYESMPWLAIQFDDEQREQMAMYFKVSGIPHCVLINSRGELLHQNIVQTGLDQRLLDQFISSSN